MSLTEDGRRRLKSRSVGSPRRRSGARRQVELGVLERLLDRRNAGGVTRLALLDADLGIETLRCSAQDAASLDWASEAAGKANAAATTGRTPLMKVFIAPLQC